MTYMVPVMDRSMGNGFHYVNYLKTRVSRNLQTGLYDVQGLHQRKSR